MTMKGGSIPQTTNFDHGLLVDRPINPAKGQIYAVTDKNRLDICYIDGKWNEGASIAEIYKEVQRLDKQVWNTESELRNFILNECNALDSITLKKGVYEGYEDDLSKWSGDLSYFTIQNTDIISGAKSLKFDDGGMDGHAGISSDISSFTGGLISIDMKVLSADDYTYEYFEMSDDTNNIRVELSNIDNVIQIRGSITSSVLCSMSQGTIYNIEVDYNNGEIKVYVNNTLEQTITSNFIPHTILTGAYTGKPSGVSKYMSCLWDNVRVEGLNQDPPLNGNAISPAVTPANLAKWEYAYFEIDPDGETITADILDAADDSVLIENISDGHSLHDISSDKNLKIRFNLSRQDTANNPKVYNAILKWINVLT